MINGFCKNKPKTEICRNCSNAIEVTNPFDDVRHFVPGPGGFCARDEKQVTKQQAIAFWHSIPVSEQCFTRKIEMVYMIKRFIKNWKYYTFLKKHPTYSAYIRNISRLKYCLFFRPLTVKDESNDDFQIDTPEWKCVYKEKIYQQEQQITKRQATYFWHFIPVVE